MLKRNNSLRLQALQAALRLNTVSLVLISPHADDCATKSATVQTSGLACKTVAMAPGCPFCHVSSINPE